jgi:hypothetical protein
MYLEENMDEQRDYGKLMSNNFDSLHIGLSFRGEIV